ncbi:MAG: aminotransferase class I/II-fold pyridoxal phosphate-dependent enzyme [Oscillospiraceae bacterium]|nr:aminotransferase class I/II-fold pyridoxal phosphate-dependent enzyme [Oscillospiraceae bacterium]
MKFSKRMDKFGVNIFSTLADKRAALVAKGMEVIDLSVGTPNIPPAPHIIKAMCSAAENPQNYIYAIKDTDALKKAVAQWYARRYDVQLNPLTQVVSLLGSQEGLAHIALSIVDEGDVVLVPDPCYPVFADGPGIAGAELYYMPQLAQNGYMIDLDAIPPEICQKAKLMVVSYPNNPTTAMATPDFYKKLIAFAKKNEIIVLHDNAYSELVFDGARCGSFLSYEGAIEVGVEFNSLSKTYGLAGARCGFCVGNEEVVRNLTILKSNMDYGMFLPIQQAAIAAITGDQSCVKTTCDAYQRRRDVLIKGFASIGWQIEKPKATMFVWAPLPCGYTDDEAFALELMEKSGVIVTPGSAFGPGGKGHVRMALVQQEATINTAVARIAASGMLKR